MLNAMHITMFLTAFMNEMNVFDPKYNDITKSNHGDKPSANSIVTNNTSKFNQTDMDDKWFDLSSLY